MVQAGRIGSISDSAYRRIMKMKVKNFLKIVIVLAMLIPSMIGAVVNAASETISTAQNVVGESNDEHKEDSLVLDPIVTADNNFSLNAQSEVNSSVGVVRQDPIQGHIENIVIMIAFADQSPEIPQAFRARMESYFNTGVRSLSNYIRAASGGEVTINSTFIGPDDNNTLIVYQDSQPRSYFMPFNAVTNPNGYTAANRTSREQQLLRRAVEAVDGSGLLAGRRLDTIRPGFADSVTFIVRGPAHLGGSSLLFPHMWILSSVNATLNGVRVWNYSFLVEEGGHMNQSVIYHEQLHVFGFPDLFRALGSAAGTPVGRWDIMTDTFGNFAFPNTHTMRRYAGWGNPPVEISNNGRFTLSPLGTPYASHPTAYVIPVNEDTGEFILIEYRSARNGTGFDNFIGTGAYAPGVVISRINPTSRGNIPNHIQPPLRDEVYIFRPNTTVRNAAAGSALGNIAHASLSANTGRTSFGSETGVGYTNTIYRYDGTNTGIVIYNVSEAGDTISFDVSIPGNQITCSVIAEGQFSNQAISQGGLAGAPWMLCEDGVLRVDEGFINWTAFTSPWFTYRANINQIIFRGPITAGASLSRLFEQLENVTTIEGLEHFDISQTTDMSRMFSQARSLKGLDISGWDTSHVTNMSMMFSGANSLTNLDVSSWNTSQVTNMGGMFGNTSNLTNLDVSNWNTSRVTNMSSMFDRTSNLASIDVSNWDTSQVTNMSGMFASASNLTDLDVSSWNTSQVTNMSGMFTQASNLASIDVSNWDTSRVVSMESVFFGASSLTSLDVSNWDTSNVTTMMQMFAGTRQLTNLDVSNWNTSNVRDMRSMFGGASSLASLDVSSWDTGQVISMLNTFSGTSSLTSLDLSNWDTSRVITMSGMFNGASSLISLDLVNWDISNVTSMSSMFSGTSSLTDLDLSNWDTSRVTSMSSMFRNANSLTSLDLASWDTNNVTSMSSMFSGASSLASLDLASWDTSRVTSMGWMFDGASSLPSLDLSSFDTSRVTNMIQMFNGTISLNELILGENFAFVGSPNLPAIRRTDYFTGYWQNVGYGIASQPRGDYVLTSAELMSHIPMADTWVWQRWDHLQVVTPEIERLVIGRFVGDIDHEAETITFNIPEQYVDHTGRFEGVITGIEAIDDTLLFFVANREWPLRVGNVVGFWTGDLVYVADGDIQYRLIINPTYSKEQTITRLTVDSGSQGIFEGTVDQSARTITFNVPSHNLDRDGRLQGTIVDMMASDDTIIFFVSGRDWPLQLGDRVGFGNGDTVRVLGGIKYTLIIAPQ